MFSSLKKKFTEIKTDLNHKIEHLEVDKNHLLNKTQRSIDPYFSTNGTNYIYKKDKSLYEVHKLCRENELLCDQFEQTVKQALVHATNLFHSMRTIEKELNLLVKSINTFNSITDKLDEFCIKLNEDFFLLEDIYEDMFLEKRLREEKEKADKEKEKLEIDLSIQMDKSLEKFLEEDSVDLQEKHLALKESIDDENY